MKSNVLNAEICEEKSNNQDQEELEEVVSWKGRKKLLQQTTLKLPKEITHKVKEMAANTHEKDLMLPYMEQSLWWSNGYPAFECPANIFEPEWIDEGLVSVQKIDCHNPQHLNHLPRVVAYAISCLGYRAAPPRYATAYITSTLLERSKDNLFKVYYPYQFWEIQPAYDSDSGFAAARSPEPNYSNNNKSRWEKYWSNPLQSRLIRVRAFVNELGCALQRSKPREWLLFDGRRVVLLPREWAVSPDLTRISSNIKECKTLLRKFLKDPKSLDLPPEVLSKLPQ